MRYAKLSVAMCEYNGELFLREQLDSIAAQMRLPDELVVFEELFLHLSETRIYLCEDMHRSYNPSFRGGYLSPDSCTEYAKGLVDQLNAWHCREPDCFAVEDCARSAASLHFYPAIVLIERRPMAALCKRKLGDPAVGRRRRGLQAWLRARRLRGA